ncbi:hypothetical protein PAMP_020620 [Pampus punctatissimus]
MISIKRNLSSYMHPRLDPAPQRDEEVRQKENGAEQLEQAVHRRDVCLSSRAHLTADSSVDRTDDSIDYDTSVSQPRAEESDEEKGRGDMRQNEMDGVLEERKSQSFSRSLSAFLLP